MVRVTDDDGARRVLGAIVSGEGLLAGSGPIEPNELVLRYLAAFGPASAADFRAWSGLAMRPAFEGLRPRLKTFQDKHGKELFDLPRAPRPDEATTVPVRFLPDYDNLVLSHADRSRVIPAVVRQDVTWSWGALLVDGFVAGTWKIARDKKATTLAIRTFAPLSRADAVAVSDEGGHLGC